MNPKLQSLNLENWRGPGFGCTSPQLSNKLHSNIFETSRVIFDDKPPRPRPPNSEYSAVVRGQFRMLLAMTQIYITEKYRTSMRLTSCTSPEKSTADLARYETERELNSPIAARYCSSDIIRHDYIITGQRAGAGKARFGQSNICKVEINIGMRNIGMLITYTCNKLALRYIRNGCSIAKRIDR